MSETMEGLGKDDSWANNHGKSWSGHVVTREFATSAYSAY